jgi:hypothetical protein
MGWGRSRRQSSHRMTYGLQAAGLLIPPAITTTSEKAAPRASLARPRPDRKGIARREPRALVSLGMMQRVSHLCGNHLARPHGPAPTRPNLLDPDGPGAVEPRPCRAPPTSPAMSERFQITPAREAPSCRKPIRRVGASHQPSAPGIIRMPLVTQSTKVLISLTASARHPAGQHLARTASARSGSQHRECAGPPGVEALHRRRVAEVP